MSFIRHRRATSPNKFECRNYDSHTQHFDTSAVEAVIKLVMEYNLADKAVIESIFEQYKPEIVVNLGAQAGVRYSITNPDAYVEANLIPSNGKWYGCIWKKYCGNPKIYSSKIEED